MKKSFLGLILGLVFCSCEKNQPTAYVPTDPLDSIHKLFMGNWVQRAVNGNTGSIDTARFFTITNDSIIVKSYSTGSIVKIKNYKFFAKDSIDCLYTFSDINADTLYYYPRHMNVRFFTKDSIMIRWIFFQPMPIMPPFFDATLVR